MTIKKGANSNQLKTGQISQIQSLKKYFNIFKAHLICRMSFFNALPAATSPGSG
jgi:hypothetical protein